MLVKENKEQRQKIEEMSRELSTVKAIFQKNTTESNISFDKSMKLMARALERKNEHVIKKDSQLNLLQKQIERLTSKRNFLEGFLADAIMQTLAKKRENVYQSSDMISRAVSRDPFFRTFRRNLVVSLTQVISVFRL